ncbi:hypothetical protein ACI1MP_37950 (plasmid) [Kitasatospora griseola]|uniref:hypothetical protein n=1 Tax=Kitasatospora griseola TaxID=2064 RepID=UPI003855ECBE
MTTHEGSDGPAAAGGAATAARLWAIDALEGGAWNRSILLKRTEQHSREGNRQRVRNMIATMDAQDPGMVWRGVEITVGSNGQESIVVLAHNQ